MHNVFIGILIYFVNYLIDSHQDVVLAVLPFFHIYAATVLMFHKMSQGIKIVTLSRFQPEVFLHTLENHKVNWLFVAPPLGKWLH